MYYPVKGRRDPISMKYIVNCVSFDECPLCYRCRAWGWKVACDRCIASGCHHQERHYRAMLKHRPRIEID